MFLLQRWPLFRLCVAAGYLLVTFAHAQMSLLQVQPTRTRGAGVAEIDDASSVEACAPLLNKFTHFQVQVSMGTPAQTFELVADTGSDAVIILSCSACHETTGTRCAQECFKGANASSTFAVKDPFLVVTETFGSGSIDAAIATDVVQVAGIETSMEVLLMSNRDELSFAGEFQGILGMGLPALSEADGSGKAAFSQQGGRAPRHDQIFFQEAGIERFSVCFRDSGKSGALRLDIPPLERSLAQVGTFHWGLDFRGLSIGPKGNKPAEVLFCSSSEMQPGMDSPCAIIPDSGTTLLTGPRRQVLELEAALCNEWFRCQQLLDVVPPAELAKLEVNEPAVDDVLGAATTFEMLLLNCSFWMTEEEGLYELPSLYFQVMGADGTEASIELSAWAYVISERTLAGESYCMHTFGSMNEDYITATNGPVWILGTPLFYEYTVAFDLGTRAISMVAGDCAPCGDDAVHEAVSLAEGTSGLRNRGRPRLQQGKVRLPRINPSLPL